jgi:hypothetical protein
MACASTIPIAAILVPAAFFLSVLSPDAKAPNGLIYLAYVGAALLALGVLALGIGLVRRRWLTCLRLDAIAIGMNPPEDINVVTEVPIGGADQVRDG